MTLGPLDEPEQVWCAGQASTAVSEPISRPIPSHPSLGLSRRTLLTPRPYSPLATGPGVTVFQCPLLSSASSPAGQARRHRMVDGTHSFPVPAAPWDRPHVTALVDGTRQSQALKPAASKDLNARADQDVSLGRRAGQGSLRVSVLRAGRRSEADE